VQGKSTLPGGQRAGAANNTRLSLPSDKIKICRAKDSEPERCNYCLPHHWRN
jgi:hypothetical protein